METEGDGIADKALLEEYPDTTGGDSTKVEEVEEEDGCPSLEEDAEGPTRTLGRKLSEPSFSRHSPADLRARRRASDQNLGRGRDMRRAQSSLETRKAGSVGGTSFVLSQATLEECKMKGTRKSYPSKTSSTDIFLSTQAHANHASLHQSTRQAREPSLESGCSTFHTSTFSGDLDYGLDRRRGIRGFRRVAWPNRCRQSRVVRPRK